MAIDFKEAIEEVSGSDAFNKWMKEQGMADLLSSEKNFTAGDVHVPAAGGTGTDARQSKPKSKPGKPKPKPTDNVSDNVNTAQKHDDPDNTLVDFKSFLQKVGERAEDEQFDKLKYKAKLECSEAELKALLDANPNLKDKLLGIIHSHADMGKAATRTVTIVRHGATHLNNQDTSVDRIRGWKDVPLSEEGRAEAQKTAEKMAKDCPDHLVCSDLERAHETAKCIAKACNMPIDEVSSGFRPWNVGDYAGQSSKTAVPILCDYAINKPNEKVPGGESFNTFRKRFFSALADAIEKYNGRVAVVTHHRGERLLSAWQAAGFPADGTIDGKEFTKKGEGTAGFENMELPADKVRAAANATVTKWLNGDIDLTKIFETKRPEQVDVSFSIEVAKVDTDQQIFYGWAYVSEENGKVIIDKQDDYILTSDLVKAAEEFTLHGGKLGDMHETRNVGRVVASFVTSKELCDAFGLKTENDRRGWILGFKVDDPQVWAKIKGGGQLELSIGGKGERVEWENAETGEPYIRQS